MTLALEIANAVTRKEKIVKQGEVRVSLLLV
jgi:hypothetical protein